MSKLAEAIGVRDEQTFYIRDAKEHMLCGIYRIHDGYLEEYDRETDTWLDTCGCDKVIASLINGKLRPLACLNVAEKIRDECLHIRGLCPLADRIVVGARSSRSAHRECKVYSDGIATMTYDSELFYEIGEEEETFVIDEILRKKE